jgi:putative endonuclease
MAGRATDGRSTNGRAAVGRQGESVAAGYLERLGYRIRERNFRCPHGEIDLIASTEAYLVFVEVKTRASETPYHPTLAITEDKKRRVRLLGEYYRSQQPPSALQPRFDVVAVTLREGRGCEPRVEHYINAF